MSGSSPSGPSRRPRAEATRLGRIVGLASDADRRGVAWAVGASLAFHLAVVAALLWTPRSEARQFGGGDGVLDAQVYFSDALPGGAPPPPPPAAKPEPKPEPVRAETPPPPPPKPPDVVIPDEKKAAPPKEKTKPVTKPVPEKKPKETAAKKPEASAKKPEKVAKEKEPETTYADTLAKIRKLAAERERTDGAGGSGPGRPGPRGPGSLPSTICDLQLGNYQGEAVGKIQRLIAYPDANPALVAEIGVQIAATGRIQKRWVEVPSGDRLFDEAVGSAIEKANPLPPLPQCLDVDSFEVVLVFKPAAAAP